MNYLLKIKHKDKIFEQMACKLKKIKNMTYMHVKKYNHAKNFSKT